MSKKLGTIAKRVIPSEYQKLVEAGYLNEKLQITEAGRIMLDHIVLQENLAEFVAAAETRIAEVAKSKKDGDTCAIPDEGEDA